MGELYEIPCSSSSAAVCATSLRKCTLCSRGSSGYESAGEKVTELPLEACRYSCEIPARHQDGQGYDRPPQALIQQFPPSRKICHFSAHQARGQGKGMLGPTGPGIDLGC